MDVEVVQFANFPNLRFLQIYCFLLQSYFILLTKQSIKTW